MAERVTSMKFEGNAEQLKRALSEVNLALKQTKLAAQQVKIEEGQKSNVKEFFHDLHAGATASQGSLKGMGQAFSAMGPMIPIVAVGALFEIFKEMDVVKNIWEGITDAIGFTTLALDEHIKNIEKTNKSVNEGAQYERALSRAMGETARQALYNDALEQGRIIRNNNATILELEAEKKKQISKQTTGKFLGMEVALTEERAKEVTESDKKTLEFEGKILELRKKNALAVATVTGLQKNLNDLNTKDSQKALENAEKLTEQLLKEYEIRSKAAADIDKQGAKDSEDIINLILKDQENASKAEMDKIRGDTDEKIKEQKRIFDAEAEGLKKIQKQEQQAVKLVAGAFDALFTGGKDGWKSLENYMVSFFERMITEVLAAIAVWAVLDILSGGGAAGVNAAGKGPGALLPFLGKTLGFAEGTNFAPGGLAMVGERGPELVNLPRGSQVIPNNRMGANNITVTGVIRGKDLALVMSRYNTELYSNT